jgi:hypothetical protein
MPSIFAWFVARAAHSARSATVPVPASSAIVTPVAHAMTTSSGTFAARCPEMTRDKVDCEMPVVSARSRHHPNPHRPLGTSRSGRARQLTPPALSCRRNADSPGATAKRGTRGTFFSRLAR